MGSKRVLRAGLKGRETMRYFKDFEFHEDGREIIPISLGMVTETGAELYIEFLFDEQLVREKNPWVAEHVLPMLSLERRVDFEEAQIQIYNFISTDPKPEFWGYYADYDWVAFARLWGKMINLPPHFPKYCRDLQQLHWHLGSPPSARPPQDDKEHHALVDARWNRRFFAALEPLAKERGLVV